MAHLLPHWTWPERVGQVTPVHVFTSGDEAELFLNGKSLGRKAKKPYEYRLRWDDVVYEPGELKVVAYKAGKEWARDSVKTAGAASAVQLAADRGKIKGDGIDLIFVTAQIVDNRGVIVPRADNRLTFAVEGPAEIVATDNGDPTSFEPFAAAERRAFSGQCVAIVRAKPNATGKVIVSVSAKGLRTATETLEIVESSTKR
jgi:beta-galactosidase